MADPIKHSALLGALAAVALIAGCGTNDCEGDCPGTVAAPSAPTAPAAPISYTVTGGFPPFRQMVEIDADGRARVVINRFDPKTYRPAGKLVRDVEVPTEPLTAIREGLADADLDSLAKPELTCADCILYQVSYGGAEFEADMLTIPDELEEPFRRLDDLISPPKSGGGGGVPDSDTSRPR